jgi:hypothetical protein
MRLAAYRQQGARGVGALTADGLQLQPFVLSRDPFGVLQNPVRTA